MFGEAASFTQVWTGDTVLARFFPGVDGFDRSAAEASLAARLAFWTGKDLARIDRIMRQAPLLTKRPDQKKLARKDYLERTIRGAAEHCTEVHKIPRLPGTVPVTPVTVNTDVTAGVAPVGRYMTTADQIEYFEGCVYVAEQHCVYCPDGESRRREAVQHRIRWSRVSDDRGRRETDDQSVRGVHSEPGAPLSSCPRRRVLSGAPVR